MYRTARVTLLRDGAATDQNESARHAVQRVVAAMTEILTAVGRGDEAEKLSVASELPAGQLCDLACHCLGFDVQAKQSMLEELHVGRRLQGLLAWMEALLQSIRCRGGSLGPAPPFSTN
jgi:Lon protease-like protein